MSNENNPSRWHRCGCLRLLGKIQKSCLVIFFLFAVYAFKRWSPFQPSRKILAIYVCNDPEEVEQQRKIKDLFGYFGKQLVIVSDHEHAKSLSLGRTSWLRRRPLVVGREQNVTTNTLFASHDQCCGHERAIMWMIANQDKFDHAWMIEDNVFWMHFEGFKSFLDSYANDDTDLLHSNRGMEAEKIYKDDWDFPYLQYPKVTENATIKPPFYKGLFMFYRISSSMIKKLDEWRMLNDGEWTFYEPLFGTLSVQDENLTTDCYLDNKVNYSIYMNYRPYFGRNETAKYHMDDLLHPVKTEAASRNNV